MAGLFLKWLVPGIVAVAGGTVLALVQTAGAVDADLSTRTTAALNATEFGWASVSVDGRDAILSGTATSQQMIDDAIARLSAVHGVRAVESRVALAEFVSPFTFSATIKKGTVTLDGAYPDESIHGALLAQLGSPVDHTGLRSGAPQTYETGAEFVISALSHMDEGQVALSDSSLNIVGRAKSQAAFDALEQLAQSVPAGITLAALKITPALASPYVWTAKFDGTSVVISGDTPNSALADELRAIAPPNIKVSTSLALASGEPSNFAANTQSLLKSLLSLEQGEATISDGTITLSGAPGSAGVADAVSAAVTQIGGTATLEPPRVAEFAFSIDKSDNRLKFSGFAPSTAARDKLAALPGADVTGLSLGRGAPEHLQSAIDFGLEALTHLAQGTFGLRGNKLSLGGRAASVADFKALAALSTQGAPQGWSFAIGDLRPPVANPFVWSAEKSAAGIMVSGYVPDEAARSTLHAHISDLAADQANPADGAPANFAVLAASGLDVLKLLDSGKVTFDGANWSIDGDVDTPQKGFAADAAYSITGLRTAGWSYSVHMPEAISAAPLPIIAPYVWRAQKAPNGTVSFSGFVPSAAFKSFAGVRAADAVDTTVLGAGAPDNFGVSAAAGLDALFALDEGSLGLAGNRWTLTGETSDASKRTAIQDALSAKVDAANWQVAIQARDSAPVVTPYLWSATKAADGTVELSGYVPSDSIKGFAVVRAGAVSRDTTAIASGEPAGFADDLLAGLDALSHLGSGKASFDGSKWSLTGEPASTEDGDLAMGALKKGSKGGASWDATLAGYPPTVSAEPPASSEPLSAAEPNATPDVISLEAPATEDAPSVPSSEPVAVAPSPEPSSLPILVEPSSASASSAEASLEPTEEREVAPTAITVVPDLPPKLVFEASLAAGKGIDLKGAVPADATAAYFGVLAGGVATDGMTAEANLPDDFLASGTAGLAALAELDEGHLGFDGMRWWLRGKAEQQAVKDDVVAKIAALPKGADWSVAIDLLASIDICRIKVAALAGRNAIIFEAGKAVLTANSLPVLDELASDLQVCPHTYVHVQGHTDGDGDADTNLALSVSRAEAVVSELIKRGVAESRLYAEGYGETDPLVPNDTKANKQKNRRIAFAVSEE